MQENDYDWHEDPATGDAWRLVKRTAPTVEMHEQQVDFE